jgi:hypothetical protein
MPTTFIPTRNDRAEADSLPCSDKSAAEAYAKIVRRLISRRTQQMNKDGNASQAESAGPDPNPPSTLQGYMLCARF